MRLNNSKALHGRLFFVIYWCLSRVFGAAVSLRIAYVDLNPVRAKMAMAPETSDYTSIKEPIRPSFNLEAAVKEQIAEQNPIRFGMGLKPLAKFEGNENDSDHYFDHYSDQQGILFSLNDYLELVDYTGRIIRPDKRGSIAINQPPILQRIGIDLSTWLKNSTEFETLYDKKFSKRQSQRYFSQAG